MCLFMAILKDPIYSLRKMKNRYSKNIVISYLNINSIRNNFFSAKWVCRCRKCRSIPTNQLLIKCYRTPYRLDISGHSGGLLTYERSEIPSRLLTQFTFNSDIQVIAVELNLRKNKWIVPRRF